jgi:hypothetical protein
MPGRPPGVSELSVYNTLEQALRDAEARGIPTPWVPARALPDANGQLNRVSVILLNSLCRQGLISRGHDPGKTNYGYRITKPGLARRMKLLKAMG